MEKHRRVFRRTAETGLGMNCRPSENLPSKHCGKIKKSPPPHTFMNTKQWVFVKNGLDDFRYGCPPCEGMITRGLREHHAPPMYPKALPTPSPRRQNKLPKDAALFSKLSPAQLAQKAFVAEIEAQLTSHPLAHYPDLEESLPVELLLKVLSVLDPDRKLGDTWAHCEGIRKKTKEHIKCLEKCSTQVDPGLRKKMPLSHPWQLLNREKPGEINLLHEDGPCLNENVRKAVSDFSNWATDIGGSKVEEEFIYKQFDLKFKSKPSCNECCVMRPDQVPLELKKAVGLNKPQEREFFQEHCERKTQNPSKPKPVKMRYGAWYLNPKLWKRQKADEPLVDPKVICKKENFKKELQKEDDLFAKLHGPAAFKEFILSKGYSMPSFLEKINIKKE